MGFWNARNAPWYAPSMPRVAIAALGYGVRPTHSVLTARAVPGSVVVVGSATSPQGLSRRLDDQRVGIFGGDNLRRNRACWPTSAAPLLGGLAATIGYFSIFGHGSSPGLCQGIHETVLGKHRKLFFVTGIVVMDEANDSNGDNAKDSEIWLVPGRGCRIRVHGQGNGFHGARGVPQTACFAGPGLRGVLSLLLGPAVALSRLSESSKMRNVRQGLHRALRT
ncbi:hypothetical protein SacglDRAFT_01977 [Saccharomonospora glauca K62]|uniref:Uncharacterized protein n=1 Tax=Saccharomonospora glauca K62 TaxID=928724 RepID=I1D1R0_9PSEU|nr:hypothetical protein SacglDRAFT_01977 [Saccharomonospora glauca K62]